MSTLWTPGGERPVAPPGQPTGPPGAPSPPSSPAREAPGPGSAPVDEEELSAELAEAQKQLLQTPASVIVANHCIGLFQLAALHMGQPQPDLEAARLAIDAMAAVVEGLGSRLGEDATALGDALNQIRLAYVQVKGSTPAQPA